MAGRVALVLGVVCLLCTCTGGVSAKPRWLRRLQETQSVAEATWSSIFSGGGDAEAPVPAPTLLPPPPPDAPAYTWLLSPAQRARGLTYLGSAERLRAALHKAATRKQLTVSVIGGSISAGAGAYDVITDAWVDRLEAYLKELLGAGAGTKLLVNNGAVPGTTSAFMCACFRRHVPEDSDIVFVEYAVNDDSDVKPLLNNKARRPFERLIRKLLMLPNHPAVVLLNAYSWYKAEPYEGTFWSNSEREYQELAWYYQLPTLSVKACCYADMAAGRAGFQVDAPREVGGDALKGKAFYWDYIHPDGYTGHRVMAELAMHLISHAARDVRANPLTDAERAAAAAPLPKPMLRDNHAALHDACFVGPAFKRHCVVAHVGWRWVNEATGKRPKWGYVATEPGKVLKLKLNTTAEAGLKDKPVLVQLAHLRSYEHMGWAEVTCVSGCECPATRFNGHSPEKKSVLVLHRLYATQHPECTLAVEVLSDTDSGEHKVKLTGAIVSDQAGEQEGLANAGAVEHVHDISFRNAGFGNASVFDIRNHV